MDGVFRRRRLPHFDVAGGTYFVTAALAGSRPARGLSRPGASGSSTGTPNGKCPPSRSSPWLPGMRIEWERCLDVAPDVRWLARRDLADIVHAAILHGVGLRYDLLAHVVIPSHIHLVFRPFEAAWHGPARPPRATPSRTPRQRVLQSLRGFTARACNGLLGRSGAFWQRECYDRVLRTEDEIRRAVEYVVLNPVTAGLCASPADWPYTSPVIQRVDARHLDRSGLSSTHPGGFGGRPLFEAMRRHPLVTPSPSNANCE